MTTIYVKHSKGDSFVPWPEKMKSWPTPSWLMQQDIPHKSRVHFDDGTHIIMFYAIRIEVQSDMYEWNCEDGFVGIPMGIMPSNW